MYRHLLLAGILWLSFFVRSIYADSLSLSARVIPSYQTIPNSDGIATASATTPQVIIESSHQPITVNIIGGARPLLDVSNLIEKGSGILPAIAIHSYAVDVYIPSSTISVKDTEWNGAFQAPTQIDMTIPPSLGAIRVVHTAIQMGLSKKSIQFDRPVRIVFPFQKGKRAGLINEEGAFREIEYRCINGSGVLLGKMEECTMEEGADLVIWTRHFTTFATFSSYNFSELLPTIFASVAPTERIQTIKHSSDGALGKLVQNILSAVRRVGLFQ